MEDFSPIQGYHPEDEYEPINSTAPDAAAPQDVPAQQNGTAAESAADAQPAYGVTNGYPPVYRQPDNQASAYDHIQAPYPAASPQQTAPFTSPAQQPYQPPQAPVQPSGYPYGYQAPQYPAADRQPQIPAGYPQPPQAYSAPVQPYAPPRPVQPVNPYAQGPAETAEQRFNTNPYASTNRAYPAAPIPAAQQKPQTPTGTKVFIIILCALLVAMVGGFIAYVAATAGNNDGNKDNSNLGYIIDDNGDDNGFDFFGYDNGYSSSYTDVEDEITLKADNGETQQRDDDNEASVGEPDAKAENITLNALPKDKDDAKYTTQSAYETVRDSVVTVVCYVDEITEDENDIVSQGTGTIISADGYIITNAHVIDNSKFYAINIVMNSGDMYQAKIIGYDTWTDLAVLKIDAKDLKPVSFGDSELIEIGDDVIAIGSPGGTKFQNSLTKGIVSAVDRELSINKYVRYIQSDAAISPGNSGGPLCNIYGQVIGITTAKTVATNFENMSFSIPSATVQEIVGDLMRYGYVKGRTRIGFSGVEVTQEEIVYYGYPAGVIVGVIDESGSLAGSDIREGDIITELDGQEITSFQDIYNVLAHHSPDDTITIKAVRPE